MDAVQHIRLIVAYRGTRYVGWQIQHNGLSVQQVLEEALAAIAGRRVPTLAAGRTDAGVHARGQVVKLCLPESFRYRADELARVLNPLLPEDVAVIEAGACEPGFDPRAEAAGKHYRYTVLNRPAKPVFELGLCWHLRRELDLAAIRAAAAALHGEHDFSAFCSSGADGGHRVRTIDRLAVRREGDCVFFDVFGRAFLKQMVRNMVGTLVEVGRGRLAPPRVSAILESRDRRRAGPCAPAQGLCLMRVYYDPEEYLRDAARIGAPD